MTPIISFLIGIGLCVAGVWLMEESKRIDAEKGNWRLDSYIHHMSGGAFIFIGIITSAISLVTLTR